MRTICLGCGDALKNWDAGRDYCLICRGALAKGPMAWDKRMHHVAKVHRAQGKTQKFRTDDPFAGFSDEEMWKT